MHATQEKSGVSFALGGASCVLGQCKFGVPRVTPKKKEREKMQCDPKEADGQQLTPIITGNASFVSAKEKPDIFPVSRERQASQ